MDILADSVAGRTMNEELVKLFYEWIPACQDGWVDGQMNEWRESTNKIRPELQDV